MMSSRKTIQAIFISLEFVTGLGCGLLGDYCYSHFDNEELTASIFNTFLSAYVSMLVGIILIGYFHFRNIGRMRDFGTATGLSLLGLLLFLVLYILIEMVADNLIPDYIDSILLPFLLPLTGAVIGLNILLIRKIRPETKDRNIEESPRSGK